MFQYAIFGIPKTRGTVQGSRYYVFTKSSKVDVDFESLLGVISLTRPLSRCKDFCENRSFVSYLSTNIERLQTPCVLTHDNAPKQNERKGPQQSKVCSHQPHIASSSKSTPAAFTLFHYVHD